MDYLQYTAMTSIGLCVGIVLNLVINGLPSISYSNQTVLHSYYLGFKPCYKWITFNIYIHY